MSRFSNGKVYKLVNGIDSKIYIGSTTQILCKRLADHKYAAKNKQTVLYTHFNTIGWDKVRIILIESVECFNKEQLTQREQHYIDLMNPSLNMNSAYVNCPHNKQHNNCMDCGGSQICQHSRHKGYCNDCGGVQMCHHERVKSRCKQCSPKYCECCGIKTSTGGFKSHTKSIKHIYNFINS